MSINISSTFKVAALSAVVGACLGASTYDFSQVSDAQTSIEIARLFSNMGKAATFCAIGSVIGRKLKI